MHILLQMSASSFTDVQFMKAFYVQNERCIATTAVVKGMNFPRNIRSRERMVQGTNGPGNECSRERIVLGTNIPAFMHLLTAFRYVMTGLFVAHRPACYFVSLPDGRLCTVNGMASPTLAAIYICRSQRLSQVKACRFPISRWPMSTRIKGRFPISCTRCSHRAQDQRR